jgi:hypothetical protein
MNHPVQALRAARNSLAEAGLGRVEVLPIEHDTGDVPIERAPRPHEPRSRPATCQIRLRRS